MEVARFYYPADLGSEVLVYYVYEQEDGTRGVEIYEDRGEVVAFSQQARAGAIGLCRYLNARERRFPGHMPTRALQFLCWCAQADGKP
jgi:hypothetical protein